MSNGEAGADHVGHGLSKALFFRVAPGPTAKVMGQLVDQGLGHLSRWGSSDHNPVVYLEVDPIGHKRAYVWIGSEGHEHLGEIHSADCTDDPPVLVLDAERKDRPTIIVEYAYNGDQRRARECWAALVRSGAEAQLYPQGGVRYADF